jgi:hypothetical protein
VFLSGLGAPSALALDATHLYFADAAAGTINRVSRDGGTPEVLVRDQQVPSSLALLADDAFWLNAGTAKLGAASVDESKSGVFSASTKAKTAVVRTVRKGPIVAMVLSPAASAGDKPELFIVEAIDDGKRGALSRVTGPTITRIAEIDGKPMALAADKTSAYVATFGATNKSKIVQAPRLPGEKKEIPFSGPGFNALDVDGDHILGTGVVEHKFGLFRVPKTGGGAVLLAPDVAPGLFAASGDDLYFVSGSDHALKKMPRTGGAATVVASLSGIEATDLAITDGWAWIAGTARGDAGAGGGAILRLSLR